MIDAPPKKPFLREWGLLIAFGVFFVSAIVGFRLWTEFQANQPVSQAYGSYLSQVAAKSPAAREYLDDYFDKYSRKTVASRHYEAVCGAVTVLADQEGVATQEISEQMSHACRMFHTNGGSGDLP